MWGAPLEDSLEFLILRVSNARKYAQSRNLQSPLQQSHNCGLKHYQSMFHRYNHAMASLDPVQAS